MTGTMRPQSSATAIPQIHVAVIYDIVAIDRRADDRHGPQPVDDGLDDERQKVSFAPAFLVSRLLRLANLRNAGRSSP
jgi:hypothetical protein